MKLLEKTIAKSLSPAYRLHKPNITNVTTFQSSLNSYLDNINSDETEENHKSHLTHLLKTQFGSQYIIEPKGNIDLIIRTREKNSKPVVLFEAKRGSNSSEMVSINDINKKSLHELVLYYMRERHQGNTDILSLIICTEYDFFIFDAKQFEKAFYENVTFRKDYISWADEKKSSTKTDFFYNSIAKPFIDSSDEILEATHFNFNNFRSGLNQPSDAAQSKKLIKQ